MFRVMHSYFRQADEQIDECVAEYEDRASAYSHASRLSSLGYVSIWVQERV